MVILSETARFKCKTADDTVSSRYQHLKKIKEELWSGANSTPWVMILTNLAEAHYTTLHTKYLSTGPCCFVVEGMGQDLTLGKISIVCVEVCYTMLQTKYLR